MNRPKDCCELLTLALTRVRESDRIGLMTQMIFNIKTGAAREVLMIRIHKARKHGPNADVCMCIVNFCPFCGKPVKQPRARKARS